MKNELTRLTGKNFTRRQFLEGMGAAGAAAVLASCGGPMSRGSLFEPRTAPPIPPITGTVVAGGAPHNCGGRCVTKAYVENGVVKRLVTDESPEDFATETMQRRACVRCRAHKGYMYRADRLLKPLKQMGTRGDVNGFVEISWDQAFTEIADQLKAIVGTYGPSALYNHYTSGDGAAVPRGGAGNDGGTCVAQRVLRLLGGYVGFHSDYSYPALYHTASFCLGALGGTPPGNPPLDAMYAEQVVLWSMNVLEMIQATNNGYYLTRVRERGVKIIAIDSRISQTSATIADAHYGCIAGTDAAMMLGMMYHLLAEPTLGGGPAGSLLDIPFIRKYVHGFFDDLTPTMYHADSPAPASYNVPAGASLSAYIMGNVRHPENLAASIYPDTIGYNVNPDDVLYGKQTPIYGQVPKTPEWAEKISGVSAATIRALAESFATKKTHIWIGGGWQRNVEGEQALMMAYALGAITKNFGVNGRSFGMPANKTAAGSLNMTRIPGEGPAAGYSEAKLPSGFYDTSKVTSPDKYMWQRIRWAFPCFIWPDVVKNGGTGKSDWNHPMVKKLGAVKAIFNFAGNCLVDQTGETAYTKAILGDKSKAQLIVVSDLYMTASAAYGDYVLPAAAAFERTAACAGAECLIYMGKAVEPPGQAKSDYDIGVGIASALGTNPKTGVPYKDTFTEGRTEEQWVHWAWDQNKITKMTYEEWQQKGIYTSNTAAMPTPTYSRFLADPAKAPLNTPTGKLEFYSQAMLEDYEARGFDSIDRSVRLVGPGAAITTKSTAAADVSFGRYVYPIPMYIPLIEGMHADGNHPDVLGLRAKGYDLMFQTYHMQYRSHSTHNNNALLNEVYKKNAKGEPAFLSPRRPRGVVWDDGVYEPVWINPQTAAKYGIAQGNRVLITNDRGQIYASAHVTQRARPGFVFIGQGAWHRLDAKGIDVGGCANTLTSARPSRICQGMTLASGTLVKIEKA